VHHLDARLQQDRGQQTGDPADDIDATVSLTHNNGGRLRAHVTDDHELHHERRFDCRAVDRRHGGNAATRVAACCGPGWFCSTALGSEGRYLVGFGRWSR
jgi:hypothetical protein